MEIWGPKLRMLSFKNYLSWFSQKAVRLETILTPFKGSLLNKGTADTALILIQAMWLFFFFNCSVCCSQLWVQLKICTVPMYVWGWGFPLDISLISFTLSSAIKIIFNVRNSFLLVIEVPSQYPVEYTTGSRYSQIFIS